MIKKEPLLPMHVEDNKNKNYAMKSMFAIICVYVCLKMYLIKYNTHLYDDPTIQHDLLAPLFYHL